MCLKTKAPKVQQPKVQPAPAVDENSALMADAKKKAAGSQGVFANIFTSTLGDAGFDTNTKRQTAATLTV